ncbi:hypothetical protein QR680_009386 [Steinernema hermaphroditum]|uniref:Tyr recombinase domain-containing protein n=1 Tax=Steinernema hermaphroditum TaxID=289476 RepID=A0AA39HP55_9BILA|nr:hypothetical protein QR680_004573 [Steinernema hermaphroditum]KAK0425788.1 hypothetical protein QR680_009386 [Steinernema hermaphroditum]
MIVRRMVRGFATSEVADLAGEMLQASREMTTRHVYVRIVRKFQEWRGARATSAPSVEEILAFLAKKFSDSKSAASTQQTAAALKWKMKFNPGPNPLNSVWITTLLEGVRRSGRSPIHREKISEAHLRRLALWEAKDRKDHRIRTLLAVLYAGCLRPAEGIGLQTRSVHIDKTRMVLSIIKDKTHKEGAARKVVIQRAPGPFCAVKLMSDWLQMAPRSPFVFANFNDACRPMSYDSARKEWKRVAAALGIPESIGLHGFRGGAATQAIEDGAPVDEIMRHGRWKRMETLKAYVESSEKTTPTASSLLSRLEMQTMEDPQEKPPTR